jgi:hypothetical protein
MKTCHGLITIVATTLVAAACGKDSVSPSATACTAETGSVTATVESGGSIVFDWDPGCSVALLLVEADGGDMWGITTDDATWDNPDQANLITPPVTYGVIPSGASAIQEPLALVSDVTYDLILWRILPEGSTTECQARFENRCVLTAHSFTR